MGSKITVSFANTFIAKVETDALSRSGTKLLFWKLFMKDADKM